MTSAVQYNFIIFSANRSTAPRLLVFLSPFMLPTKCGKAKELSVFFPSFIPLQLRGEWQALDHVIISLRWRRRRRSPATNLRHMTSRITNDANHVITSCSSNCVRTDPRLHQETTTLIAAWPCARLDSFTIRQHTTTVNVLRHSQGRRQLHLVTVFRYEMLPL